MLIGMGCTTKAELNSFPGLVYITISLDISGVQALQCKLNLQFKSNLTEYVNFLCGVVLLL